MSGIRNPETYCAVVDEDRLANMKQFCKENGIESYAAFMRYCRKNQPEWARTLVGAGGRRAMIAFFKQKYHR